MNDDIYALLRYKPTNSIKPNVNYSDGQGASFDKIAFGNAMLSQDNIDYLTKRVIDHVDPLRNNMLAGRRPYIRTQVERLLTSWKNIGKFDQLTIMSHGRKYAVGTMSSAYLMDAYNEEFISEFSESIVPVPDVTKVKSVTNPNGLYAQQERVIKIASKPIPFYEKSIYKRLNDFNMDQIVDETENPFYRMDHNPRLSDAERKKRDLDTTKQESYLDRENISYRMIPKY